MFPGRTEISFREDACVPSDPAAILTGVRLVNCAYGASHTLNHLEGRSHMDDSHTRPRTFTLPERIQIARTLHTFGLGHVRLPGITTITPVCHGLANGCTCPKHGKPNQAQAAVSQPWDVRPARAA